MDSREAHRSLSSIGPDHPPRGLSRATSLNLEVSRRSSRGEADDALSVAFLFRAMLHWWKLAVPIGLILAAGGSAVVWYLFAPVYRAAAWIQIEDTTPYVVQPAREESQRFVQTQIEMLRSPLVVGPVVGQPEIAALPEIGELQDPITTIARRISVTPVGNSELFQVSYESPEPANAAVLVNAVIDGYFRLRANNAAERTQRVIELLEQEQARRGRQVQQLREQLRDLGRDVLEQDALPRTTLGDVVVMNHPLQPLLDRLTTGEVDRKILEAQITAMQEALEKTEIELPEVLVETELEIMPEIAGLAALIARKRESLHGIEAVSARGAEDPAYRRLAEEIERHVQALQKAREDARPRVHERMKALALLEKKDQLGQMQARLEGQVALEQLLRERYQQQLEEISKSGDKSLEFEFTRAELAREEQVFEQIAQRALTLRTEMRAPARVTLLKRAVPPTSPVEQLPYKHLAIAVLAGLCLPFGVAIGWERMVQRISNSEEIETKSHLHVVGEITQLPLRSRLARGGVRRDLSLFEESVDNLRTCLVLAEQQERVQVLAVASAVAREGKSSVSSQLAVSIARATGEPTLLIDGDMRDPDLHQIFQLQNSPGLSKVLDGRCTLDEAISTEWSDLVHVLPAGKLHKNPHKLVGSGAFRALLDQLRERYRHIVIDTPPVLAASESLVMAKEADGTLICTRRGHSRAIQVKLAYRRLLSTGAQPIGAVLNAVPVKRYASTYGAYEYATPQE